MALFPQCAANPATSAETAPFEQDDLTTHKERV